MHQKSHPDRCSCSVALQRAWRPMPPPENPRRRSQPPITIRCGFRCPGAHQDSRRLRRSSIVEHPVRVDHRHLIGGRRRGWPRNTEIRAPVGAHIPHDIDQAATHRLPGRRPPPIIARNVRRGTSVKQMGFMECSSRARRESSRIAARRDWQTCAYCRERNSGRRSYDQLLGRASKNGVESISRPRRRRRYRT